MPARPQYFKPELQATEKNRATGKLIRKNKETDLPVARVAALTDRFDRFGWQPFKLSFRRDGHRDEPTNGATTQDKPRNARIAKAMNGRIMVIYAAGLNWLRLII